MPEKEYIERNALIAEYDRVHIGPPGGARKLMVDAPAVDVVAVVRCKQCKHGEIDDEDFPNQYFCRHNGCDWNNENHFCGYGERKKHNG